MCKETKVKFLITGQEAPKMEMGRKREHSWSCWVSPCQLCSCFHQVMVKLELLLKQHICYITKYRVWGTETPTYKHNLLDCKGTMQSWTLWFYLLCKMTYISCEKRQRCHVVKFGVPPITPSNHRYPGSNWNWKRLSLGRWVFVNNLQHSTMLKTKIKSSNSQCGLKYNLILLREHKTTVFSL
jgi:hypothetical protein